jgi:hypothetical protein
MSIQSLPAAGVGRDDAYDAYLYSPSHEQAEANLYGAANERMGRYSMQALLCPTLTRGVELGGWR